MPVLLMIIDDNPSLRLKKAAKGAQPNHRVLLCPTFRKACQFLAHARPALIGLSATMRDAEGLEAFVKLFSPSYSILLYSRRSPWPDLLRSMPDVPSIYSEEEICDLLHNTPNPLPAPASFQAQLGAVRQSRRNA